MEEAKQSLTKLCTKAVKYMEAKIRKNIQRITLVEYVLKNVLKNPLFYSGSRAEGIHSVSSDTDFMFEVENVIVSNRKITINDENLCSIELHTSKVHPGYAKLEVHSEQKEKSEFQLYGKGLKSLCHANSNMLSNVQTTEYWKKRMKNIFDYEGRQNDDHQHGPSVTCTYFCGGKLADVDRVLCFKSEWPTSAYEWFERDRKHGWPSEELQQKVRSLGCNVGPIGHAHSNERELEWRFSFSKAERELVWSFNPTQYMCINIMKMFFQHEINPKYPDVFSSYFVKTSMFWIVEQTPANYWQPENLINCLDVLLARIIRGVNRKCINSYFIRENNMLDVRQPSDLQNLFAILTIFENSGNEKWKQYLEFTISQRQKHDLYYYHIDINCLSITRHFIYDHVSRQTLYSLPMHIRQVIETLNKSKQLDVSEIICRQLIAELEATYCESLYRISDKNDNLSHTELRLEYEKSLMEQRNADFCSGRLQLALYYFKEDRYIESLEITEEIIKTYHNGIVHYTFWHRVTKPISSRYSTSKPRQSLSFTMGTFVALDVVLMPVLFSDVSEAINTLFDNRSVAFVEPLFFANLLTFHSHLKLGNTMDCEVCIKNMSDIVNDPERMEENNPLNCCMEECYDMLAKTRNIKLHKRTNKECIWYTAINHDRDEPLEIDEQTCEVVPGKKVKR